METTFTTETTANAAPSKPAAAPSKPAAQGKRAHLEAEYPHDNEKLEIANYANMTNDKAFNAACELIVNGGRNLKKGLQIAIRRATLQILNNKDAHFADILIAKLELLDSKYYYKLVMKNLPVYCGMCKPEPDKKGNMKYIPLDKPPLYYSNKIGQVGWQLKNGKKTPLGEYKKIYEAFFKNVRFTQISIKGQSADEDENASDKKLIDKAKKLYDLAKTYRDGKEIWERIDSPWIKVFEYIAAMPAIEEN